MWNFERNVMTIKRISVAFVVVVLGINLAIAAKIYSDSSTKPDKDNPYSEMELITQVMELVRKEYVDTNSVTYRDLTYGALKGMLNSLDPHSQFMEPQMYEDMKEDTEGKFGGIGIVINMSKEGFLTVVAPLEDTPGAKAGLLPGDRIIKIDGKVTEKMGLQEAVRQLRGDPGTKVTITIFRSKAKDPGDKIKDHTIERAEINVDSVKDAKILEDGIGYVRITQFNEPTADEFEKALAKLNGEGMTALIIDLRNNPGGLLESARKIASEFIPAGQMIVSTEGRDLAQKSVYRSDSGKKQAHYPLVLLVNAGSASGSEIVAGCAPGPPPRGVGWRNHVWQGFRAKHYPVARRVGAAPDHGQVLHTEPQGHPRARCDTGYYRADFRGGRAQAAGATRARQPAPG